MRIFMTVLLMMTSLYAFNDGRQNGKQLFSSKGCTMCHKKDIRSVGPSIETIAIRYSGKENQLIAYLNGTGKAIVEPGRDSVMRPQLTKIRSLRPSDKRDIARYIITIMDREF